MKKRCTEANEQSLTSRMARDPNWRQVDESGIPGFALADLLPAKTIWLRNIDQLLRRLGNEFQMAGDPGLRKIGVRRVIGAIVHDNILEIEGT